MFSRVVTHQLKPNVEQEFSVACEKQILPLLRQQPGFVDQLLLVSPEKKQVISLTLWETQGFAETYNWEIYPEIEKILTEFSEGTPAVKNFDVQYSTFHKTAGAAAS